MELKEADPLIGTLVADRYRVVRKLGEGGMGVVYQAVHEALRKPVALKLLASTGRIDKEAVARFEREAIAAANLRHPNIAEATDFGRLPDGALYLIMEYVEGTTLRRLIREQGRLPPERALPILEQVAAALATAHASEVVHRDLKPENIIVTTAAPVSLTATGSHNRADFVKVIDFGIARIRNATFGGGATGLTKAGTVFGTPEYMAPEQVMGQPVDAAADQYALGVLAFEVLTGKPPFSAPDIGQLMMMHVGAPIPSTRERAPGMPPAADGVIMKMLAKMPDERFASVEEAMRALSAAFAAPPASVAAPTSQPGAGPPSAGVMVRFGPAAPSAATEADATAATLRSFSFDAPHVTASPGGTAMLSTPSVHGMNAAAAAVTGAQRAMTGSQPAVTGAQLATTGAQPATGPQPMVVTGSYAAAGTAAKGAPMKRPPTAALVAAGAIFVAALVGLVFLVRALTGERGLPPEVVAALAEMKGGKVRTAAPIIKKAVSDDPDLANDATLAKGLAESVDDDDSYRAVDDLLQSTALGRSQVMASALAAMAMKDSSPARDDALMLLRQRQDLLTGEMSARVRLRDADDCDALAEAVAAQTEVGTPDTKRDLERVERDHDCKRMLRQKGLCDACKGGGKLRPPSGPGGPGPGGPGGPKGPKKPK